MYVCGQPHTTPALPLGKIPSTNWTGGWKGQRFGLEALKKWKISWLCQEPNLNYSFIYPGHSLPTIPTALSQLPYCSQSYPEYYKVVQIWPGLVRLVYTQISPGHIWTTLYVLQLQQTVVTAATSHLGRNEYMNNNMKMDYSKMETMTRLILTCSLQFHVLFSHKLCACHKTECHYIQALFHFDCAPCANWS